MPVVMGANIKKTSVRINAKGDVVHPKTKEVIESNQEEIPQPTAESQKASVSSANPASGSLSILEQIEEAKRNLKALEELKKLKIAEKKKELELLEQ